VFSLKFQSAPAASVRYAGGERSCCFTAKGQNIPTFLVGHVTKDGSLAGPKALEHVVDSVLVLRRRAPSSPIASSRREDRFGAVSELGVFEMTSTGLRPCRIHRSCSWHERRLMRPFADSLSVEGSRPIFLVEVRRSFRTESVLYTHGPRLWRAASISKRLSVLLAVLENRARSQP